MSESKSWNSRSNRLYLSAIPVNKNFNKKQKYWHHWNLFHHSSKLSSNVISRYTKKVLSFCELLQKCMQSLCWDNFFVQSCVIEYFFMNIVQPWNEVSPRARRCQQLWKQAPLAPALHHNGLCHQHRLRHRSMNHYIRVETRLASYLGKPFTQHDLQVPLPLHDWISIDFLARVRWWASIAMMTL